MEWLGYVRRSRYDETLEKCRNLEDEVRRLEKMLSELQTENSDLRKRLEQAISKPRIDVTEVKGIGAKRGEKLKKAGILTVRDLAEASVETLARELEVSEALASKLTKRAKAILARDLKVEVEDSWFAFSHKEDGSDLVWWHTTLLFTNKLDKDTTVNTIILNSSYSEQRELNRIINIEKNGQRREEVGFLLGKQILKVDGTITVVHSYGKETIKVKADYTGKEDNQKI